MKAKLLLLTLTASVLLPLQAGEWLSEYDQKAKIMEYLISTVQWPTNTAPAADINICIFGKLASMDGMNKLNGKVIQKHKTIVREIKDISQAKHNCQVVYVTNAQKQFQSKVIQTFNHQPILMIGDMENFAKEGGSINFTNEKERVAITVNIESMKESNLRMDLSSFDKITVVPDLKDLK